MSCPINPSTQECIHWVELRKALRQAAEFQYETFAKDREIADLKAQLNARPVVTAQRQVQPTTRQVQPTTRQVQPTTRQVTTPQPVTTQRPTTVHPTPQLTAMSVDRESLIEAFGNKRGYNDLKRRFEELEKQLKQLTEKKVKEPVKKKLRIAEDSDEEDS